MLRDPRRKSLTQNLNSWNAEGSLEDEAIVSASFGSDSEKGNDSIDSLLKFVKDKVGSISGRSVDAKKRKRRSEDVIGIPKKRVSQRKSQGRTRSDSDASAYRRNYPLVPRKRYYGPPLREIEDEDRKHLFCEKMTPEEFDKWLDDHNLTRLKSSFDSKNDLFTLSERRNVLEVSGAKLEELLELLFLPKTASLFNCFDRESFISIFLCTYELFTTDENLFSELYDIYMNIPASFTCSDIDTKDSILSFLERLMKLDYQYFNETLKMDIHHFLSMTKSDFPIYSLRNMFSTELLRKRNVTEDPIIPLKISNLTLEDIHYRELARQLTLKEQQLFEKVRRQELMKVNSPNPNLSSLLDHHNKIVSWVKTEILRRGKADSRKRLISLFLKAANELYTMKNYSTLSQVILALGSTEIQKLKRSWTEELTETKNFFHSLLFADRYNLYLSEIETIDEESSFIPLVSYVCEMATKLNEVVKTFKKCKKVNWNKMKSLHTIMTKGGMMKKFVPFQLEEVPIIQQFLKEAEVWEEGDLMWKIACSLEEFDKEYDLLNTNNLWDNIEFNDEEWEFLYMNATKEKYKKGEIIIHENSEMKKLYQIKSGEVQVMKGKQVVKEMGENMVMGFSSYLNPFCGHTSQHTYIAASNVCVYTFLSSEVLSLCEQETHFSKAVNHWIALQLFSDSFHVSPPVLKRPASTFEEEFGIEDEEISYESPCHVRFKNQEDNGIIICTQNYVSFISESFSV
eukprot:TRINITY_DN713_c0_g1_i2.p1 TRINITY_DN713_c0_g1~~TRINITY_DN713_c0_g1_i2.p1  ORF type:complete len:740 (-),score=149.84 TRINITY_DN713_c0_g1_i2:1473-3692(-)